MDEGSEETHLAAARTVGEPSTVKDIDEHTDEQKLAIGIHDKNLQIVACAGSGKTRVVASRIIKILKNNRDVTPENIVAFTFTEKAAAELKDRITRLYQKEFGTVQSLAGMYVGTIHGFCLDLLQRHLYRYLKFDVLDDVKQRLLIDRFYQQSGMASLGMRRWVESDTYIALLRILREADIDPDVLNNNPVKNALRMYQNLLDSQGYLDYDEMVLKAAMELQGNHELQEMLRRRIKYLTVDEYQDISPIQELLIEQIHALGANLCVVGDDDQNIYQWRGSDVNYIIGFQDNHPGSAQVPLEANFRSSKAIVEVAHRVVSVNQSRLPKKMRSGGRQDYERGDLLCLRFNDPIDEAEWIAEKIASMRGMPFMEKNGKRGLSWSDFAILLRSVRHCAGPIISALRSRDIPYVVTGMAALFDTPEVTAAVGTFQYMAGEIDIIQLKALWRAAVVGISEEGLLVASDYLSEMARFRPEDRFQVYNLQRVYLDFLTKAGLVEDDVPGGRGELVYYNLGKFSQVISDYEEIHFKSEPQEKYKSFSAFLRHQAPSYYPEGGQDNAYASPDAVKIMTVHQAKGLEFPAVFIPCLQRNRFPARKQSNRVWNHLPRAAIRNAQRYDSSPEDERRLLYVALTRAEKYLFCSWAPDPSNQLYTKPSVFWDELSRMDMFLTREPPAADFAALIPAPRSPLVNVELSFSDLKYLFECPYQFKLRLLYGFNPPLHEALGYGRSLHNVLAEIHRRSIGGETISPTEVSEMIGRHLHLRYAYPALQAQLRSAAEVAIDLYMREHGPHLDKLIHAEEAVQLSLPNGVVVNGRIDLIKRTDTNEVIVVDFKSSERAQSEEVTRLQLHVYALGYFERFGQKADLIEVHNLDDGGSMREMVDNRLMNETLEVVENAGQRIKDNMLDRVCNTDKCQACDMLGLCIRQHGVK